MACFRTAIKTGFITIRFVFCVPANDNVSEVGSKDNNPPDEDELKLLGGFINEEEENESKLDEEVLEIFRNFLWSKTKEGNSL